MAGANLALVGNELVQFGRAEQLEPGLYRLSNFLRGRRATERAAAGHAVGETFCMIDPSTTRPVELLPSAIGAVLSATAHGLGDVAPLPQAERLVIGEGMRPPPACHFRIWRAGSEVQAVWTRRSYLSWAWVDGIGDSQDSFPELYRLTVQGPAGTVILETESRAISLAVSQLPGQADEAVSLSVVTVGPMAPSREITASIIL